MFFLLQINTFTLEPSFNGLTTTGNFNLLFIILTSCGFFLDFYLVQKFEHYMNFFLILLQLAIQYQD